MDIRKKFGDNVRRLRLAKDLSQEKFAFEADIHRTYVSDLERGVRNPTIIVVEKLANALDVDISALFEDT